MPTLFILMYALTWTRVCLTKRNSKTYLYWVIKRLYKMKGTFLPNHRGDGASVGGARESLGACS